ncbi:MarR family winged helix-turn-helix transcriptional regulator [Neobacillus dielmonensis]|uniref:MarR family winged helix-turn-helix transcriptional regulator n=1 Tax=Neobacillus dielmonensis TaxID=1347369 RepID=UPI0005AB3614|nr:MarR family transcriptional regulator [Neobacillus dielmonensis]
MKLSQKFFHQLLMLYRPFEKRLNIELSKHDLHRAQWTIIYYLENFGTATLVELSNYQGVEKPTITRTVSQLEELGYVEQVPGKDKRKRQMQLTESGKQMYQTVRMTVDEYEKDILKGIPEDDQLTAIRVMDAIRTNIIQ